MSGPGTRRRSRGRIIAVAVWLVVFLVVAITTLVGAVGHWSRPADQHIPAVGGTVTIGAPGEYAVYLERHSGVSTLPGQDIAVAGPSGETVPVRPPPVSETYTVDDRVGFRVGTFTADRPGTYTVLGSAVTPVTGDELVVTTRTVGALVGVVSGLVGTGFLLVLGIVGSLLLLVLGRRRPPPPWGPPWGGQPPGPWAPPGRWGPPGQPGPPPAAPWGTPPGRGNGR